MVAGPWRLIMVALPALDPVVRGDEITLMHRYASCQLMHAAARRPGESRRASLSQRVDSHPHALQRCQPSLTPDADTVKRHRTVGAPVVTAKRDLDALLRHPRVERPGGDHNARQVAEPAAHVEHSRTGNPDERVMRTIVAFHVGLT